MSLPLVKAVVVVVYTFMSYADRYVIALHVLSEKHMPPQLRLLSLWKASQLTVMIERTSRDETFYDGIMR